MTSNFILIKYYDYQSYKLDDNIHKNNKKKLK